MLSTELPSPVRRSFFASPQLVALVSPSLTSLFSSLLSSRNDSRALSNRAVHHHHLPTRDDRQRRQLLRSLLQQREGLLHQEDHSRERYGLRRPPERQVEARIPFHIVRLRGRKGGRSGSICVFRFLLFLLSLLVSSSFSLTPFAHLISLVNDLLLHTSFTNILLCLFFCSSLPLIRRDGLLL